MKGKQEEIAAAFIEVMGKNPIRKELVLKNFTNTTTYTSVFGERFGADKIETLYIFFNDIFPVFETEIVGVVSRQNITTVTFKANCYYGGKLIDAHVNEVLDDGASDTLKLIATTPPVGIEMDFFAGAAFVFEKEKVALLNITSNMSQMEKYLLSYAFLERLPIQNASESSFIHHIQRLVKQQLTPMEIKTLSFSLCGFSSKQAAKYLCLSPRTIEGYLQNGMY